MREELKAEIDKATNTNGVINHRAFVHLPLNELNRLITLVSAEPDLSSDADLQTLLETLNMTLTRPTVVHFPVAHGSLRALIKAALLHETVFPELPLEGSWICSTPLSSLQDCRRPPEPNP
jgi:hypothetical protein